MTMHPRYSFKRRAWQRGKRAEFYARMLLRFKAYRILAHNWRCPAGEIDIIARRGRVLIFVEVKAHRHVLADGARISTHQWRRIGRAAQNFVGRRSSLQHLVWRFDRILFNNDIRLPRHQKDVWRFD